jgi:GNAT superfamily N-acetyltransferase
VAVGGGLSPKERIVGHLCLEPDGMDGAEVAIAVADAYQHRGIGLRLMASGIAWAERKRISRFTATMLVINAPIRRLLEGLDLPIRLRLAGGGVTEITIELAGESLDVACRGPRTPLLPQRDAIHRRRAIELTRKDLMGSGV